MTALLLVATGMLIIVGVKQTADKVIRAVVGLVLIITFLPCVFSACARTRPLVISVPQSVGWVVLVVIVALVGFVLWGGRRQREQARERPLSARRRALPPPPLDGHEGGGLNSDFEDLR